MDYVSKIREILRREKVNYDELSEITGKSRNTISNYMTRKSKPDVDFLKKVADHFGTPLSYFFEETVDKALDREERYGKKRYVEERLSDLEKDMEKVKKMLDLD